MNGRLTSDFAFNKITPRGDSVVQLGGAIIGAKSKITTLQPIRVQTMKIKNNCIGMPFGRLLKPPMKLLAAAVLAGGMLTTASAQDSITVADPSFEESPYNPEWPHYTTVIPMGVWDASMAGIGVNDVTGPFWDNGGAVDGSRVFFAQHDGVLVQHSVTGFQVGETYWIQFFANARVSDDTPVVSVLEQALGNVWLKTTHITPVGGAAGTGNPFVLVNAMATATATTGDLYFNKSQFSNPTNGAATLLLDGISIIKRSVNDVVVANPSFEASGTNQTAPGYVSAIAGWTISGPGNGCAINQAAGPFADNGTIPDGGNVLVVQSGRSVSQVLKVIPGMKYQLSLYANSRAASAMPTALLTIGGNTAYSGPVPSVGGSNPYYYPTYTFTAASTTVTLVIANTTDGGTDSALLVDNLRLVKLPESINVANPSFEQAGSFDGNGYGAIPGWAGGNGVNVNPPGPFWNIGGAVDGGGAGAGTHAAFKQGYGLTGQGLSGFQVGETYWIQFYANIRSGFDSSDMSVFEAASTVGGAALTPPINITATDPFTFINVPFTAAATSGDLNILNSPHTPADNALVMDGFSVIRRTTNDIVIQNPSFEASGTVGLGGVGQAGIIAGWAYSGGSGPPIIGQAGNPYLDSGEVPPDGNNALIIQGIGACSQTLHGLTVGKSYRLTLYISARGGPSPASATITIDGQTAYSGLVPQTGSQPFHLVSFDFVASAADVTLALGNDNGSSYFVDNVRVFAPTPIAPVVDVQPQPASATRYGGGAMTYTASVSGYPAPQLQWQHAGTNLPGATSATLALSNLQLTAAGSYVLHATNSAGSTNSSTVTLTVLPVTCSYASAVMAQNPMGYWRFSDGFGTNAFDYAGGNDASDANYLGNGGSGPATLQAGPRPPTFPGYESTNTAPFLDGVSQGYASSVSLFNNRSNFTIMGWFNIDPAQYPISNDPFAHAGADQRASLFGQQWAAELGFYQGTNLYFFSTGISGTIFANTNVTPGVWNLVAAVSDAAANTTTLYLNGAVVGTASACPGANNAYLFSIGKNVAYYPSGGYDNALFPGSIDEVATFDHALSASAVQALYNVGTGSSSVNQSPTNITTTVASGQMMLTWPQDHTGWVLEAQTNSLSVGLGTNWVRIPSSATTNQVSVPVNPANPTVFYRLVYP